MSSSTSGPTICLYLAALPADMPGERALLVQEVFPDLTQAAAKLGLDLVILDPAEEPRSWDLGRRLDAISSCHIFLAFLGERYGDPPASIPEVLVARYPFLAENSSRSLLDLEIACALSAPSARSSFYLRGPSFSSQLPEERRTAYAPGSPAAVTLLAEFKTRVRASGFAVVDGYASVEGPPLERATHLAALAKQVLAQLSAVLVEIRAERTLVTAPAALPPEKPPVLHENVQFTVYRPRVVPPLRWAPLLAFAHLEELPADAGEDEPDPIAEVQEQARRVLGDLAPSYSDLTEDSRHAVPHESEITFLPVVEGIEFNPPRRTFLWQEAVHREEFRMRAAASLDGQTARGRLSVFLGSLLLAEVTLRIKVDREAGPYRPEPPAERDSIRPFRNIFASYSHRDATVVEEFERYGRALGDRYLRDVHDLRSGEVWNEKLMHLIEEADVFQLFWSRHAMRSQFVEQEWRYALSLGRRDFIRPTYWEVPLPEDSALGLPPQELHRLHFQLLRGGADAHGPRGDLPGKTPVIDNMDFGERTMAERAPSPAPETGEILLDFPPRGSRPTAGRPEASSAPPPSAYTTESTLPRSSAPAKRRLPLGLLAAAMLGVVGLGLGTFTLLSTGASGPTASPGSQSSSSTSMPSTEDPIPASIPNKRSSTSSHSQNLSHLSAQLLSISRIESGRLRATVKFRNTGSRPVSALFDEEKSVLSNNQGGRSSIRDSDPGLVLRLGAREAASYTFDFEPPTLDSTRYSLTLLTEDGHRIRVAGSPMRPAG